MWVSWPRRTRRRPLSASRSPGGPARSRVPEAEHLAVGEGEPAVGAEGQVVRAPADRDGPQLPIPRVPELHFGLADPGQEAVGAEGDGLDDLGVPGEGTEEGA